MRKSLFALVFLVFCPMLAAQQALNNDDLIKMLKAQMPEDVILTSIQDKPGQYATGPDDLIALKQAGATSRIIDAVLAKALKEAAGADHFSFGPAQVTAVSEETLPPGIQHPGAYYKDKDGVWRAIPSEIPTWATAGRGKMLASGGFRGADVDGILQGKESGLALSLPIEILLFSINGTANPAEAQLGRFHVHSDSRRFRTMKGTFLGSKSDPKADTVNVHFEVESKHLLRLKLDASLGRGEYGVVFGGTGRIYTFHVTE